MEHPMNTEERSLLAQLRRMWETVDPPPPDLAARSLLRLAMEDLESLEVELMSLQQELSPAGARGPETASTITFASESLTVMITVSPSGVEHHRLDGWIAPSAALRLELRTATGVRDGLADIDGRFAFTEVPAGLIQLVIHPTDGASVRLSRPVVTPATTV
jgi:hypothetical protein